MASGIVTKSTGSWYLVLDESSGDYINCRIRGSFRQKGIKSTNPVAVGDLVHYEKTDTKHGIITELHDRKNYLIRKSSNLSKQSHILAANIDQAFLFVTLIYPFTTTEFIDRFLVTAEAYQVPVIILFNKVDVYDEMQLIRLAELTDIYESAGYRCIRISALEGLNTRLVKDLMKGNINLFSGHSGTGKSTLINAIEPGLKLKTTEISKAHKTGKHTTTFYEMFQLSFGGFVVDSPGIKGFGLFQFDKEEIYHFFPEIFKAASNCKFHNCLHLNEPGCAVVKDVEEGKISLSRYENYLKILTGDDERYRKPDY
ncbi:MAG: ribosome small subunit-dependent GTPase A [Bacteroidota bacterium]